MTRKFVFQWVFVLLLLSLPGLASPTLQGSAELSLERAIPAEPVMLQACLLAPAIDGNQVLVSSEMLMTLSMVGPQGPCKRARNIQGFEVNPGSLWMVPIFLTKESPRWCKQICLNEEFVLQGAGDYLVTIEWLRRPVDEKARMNILSETKLKFPGKALFFEEGFFFSKQISLRIEPPSGLDKKAYEGTNQCPLCEPAILLQRFPTSTYAGYVLARKLLDLSDWRFKVGTPASAIQAGKEHPEWATRSQSDVELFNLVEKHIQGGNVPESLRAVLYGYYGEQLVLRGRAAEAEAAFCQAVKEKPGDAKGEAYFTRAQQFLDALRKHGA